MNKKSMAGLVALLFLVVGGYLIVEKAGQSNAESSDKVKAVIYKSPDCGCCVGHSAYLKKQGFDVETVNVEDINSVKTQHNIPYEMQSCHTTIIGEYFVEGHVPIEAINKLLAEKPDVDGIALPGMPAGSPGMPGVKRGDFEIFSLKKGETSDFIKI